MLYMDKHCLLYVINTRCYTVAPGGPNSSGCDFFWNLEMHPANPKKKMQAVLVLPTHAINSATLLCGGV